MHREAPLSAKNSSETILLALAPGPQNTNQPSAAVRSLSIAPMPRTSEPGKKRSRVKAPSSEVQADSRSHPLHCDDSEQVTTRGIIDRGYYQDGEICGLTFIAGQRGMGKTTEAIRLVERNALAPSFFFDTVGKHVALLPGFVQFSQPGPMLEYLRTNRGRRVRIVYVPRDVQPEEHLIAVLKMVRAFGWMVFCIDEIDTFCGQEWGVKGMPIELYNLVHFGRHFQVSMLCTARDPASLSIGFRSQCAFMRIFRTDEDNYVKYFAGRIGKANAEKLRALQRTYFCFGNRAGAKLRFAAGRAHRYRNYLNFSLNKPEIPCAPRSSLVKLFGAGNTRHSAPAFSGTHRRKRIMKFWHVVIGVAVVFLIINVWASSVLKGVPVVGGYLGQ